MQHLTVMEPREIKRQNFFTGATMAIPIVVGYVALGIPFGILGVKIGLPVWVLVLMSIFVFAGSAQFVALQLIEAKSGIFPIITVAFILNLRHFLMAMSLGDVLHRVKIPFLTYLAHSITDESYGVNIVKADDGKKLHSWNMFGTNLVAHVSWVLATYIGASLGKVLPVDEVYTSGALPIMFAVLLGMQFKKTIYLILALISMLFTIVLLRCFGGSWSFLITALVIPTVFTIYHSLGNNE
ncbi:AzlC family ABC transporter permease [bacterium]|nr:AzlC family ABC transporter permease [bacterium]